MNDFLADYYVVDALFSWVGAMISPQTPLNLFTIVFVIGLKTTLNKLTGLKLLIELGFASFGMSTNKVSARLGFPHLGFHVPPKPSEQTSTLQVFIRFLLNSMYAYCASTSTHPMYHALPL